MYFINNIFPQKVPSHSVSIHFSSELTDNSAKNPPVNNTVHHVNSFVHQCLHLGIPQCYRNFTRKLFSTKTIFLSPNHKNQGSAKDNGNQLLLPQQQNKSAQCSFSQVTSLCTRRHPCSVDSPLWSSTTPTLFHSIHQLLKPVHSQTPPPTVCFYTLRLKLDLLCSIGSIDSPLSSSIAPSLFHSTIKTFLFCKSFPL